MLIKTLKKTFSFIVSLAIVSCSVFILERFCHIQTDGFAVDLIRESFPSRSTYPNLTSSEEETSSIISNLLNQPLRYLGRGGQCFAFATEDGQYVVKLLKYNNNYPKIWFRLIPFPFGLEKIRQKKFLEKQQKLDGEYESYRIALQDLKEETGIVYFHIHQGTLSGKTLIIQDKLGSFHSLPADNYQFYIQKRGTPLYPGIESLLEKGKIEEAKQVLAELSHYLIKRCEKQITDGDDGIWRNFAFYQGHPFQIDIGQFAYDSTLLSKEGHRKDLLIFTQDFRNWLEKTEPSLSSYFLHLLTEENTCL